MSKFTYASRLHGALGTEAAMHRAYKFPGDLNDLSVSVLGAACTKLGGVPWSQNIPFTGQQDIEAALYRAYKSPGNLNDLRVLADRRGALSHHRVHRGHVQVFRKLQRKLCVLCQSAKTPSDVYVQVQPSPK